MSEQILIIRPIQADLSRNHNVSDEVNSYCKVRVGWRHGKTSVAKKGGQAPQWSENLAFRPKNDQYAMIHVYGEKKVKSFRSHLGKVTVDLQEAANCGESVRWYDLIHKDNYMGQILVEIRYLQNCLS